MDLWLRIGLWVLVGAAAILVLWAAIKGRRPLKSLLSSGTQGLCALGLVNLLGGLTGVSLGVSWLTVGGGFCLGVPGVITLLLLNVILV